MELPKIIAWVVKKILGCRDTIMKESSLHGDLSHILAMCQRGDKYQIRKMHYSLLPQLSKVS